MNSNMSEHNHHAGCGCGHHHHHPEPPKPRPIEYSNEGCYGPSNECLTKKNYLSEFKSDLEKKFARENLGLSDSDIREIALGIQKGLTNLPIIQATVSEDEPQNPNNGDVWFDGENFHSYDSKVEEWNPIKNDLEDFFISSGDSLYHVDAEGVHEIINTPITDEEVVLCYVDYGIKYLDNDYKYHIDNYDPNPIHWKYYQRDPETGGWVLLDKNPFKEGTILLDRGKLYVMDHLDRDPKKILYPKPINTGYTTNTQVNSIKLPKKLSELINDVPYLTDDDLKKYPALREPGIFRITDDNFKQYIDVDVFEFDSGAIKKEFAAIYVKVPKNIDVLSIDLTNRDISYNMLNNKECVTPEHYCLSSGITLIIPEDRTDTDFRDAKRLTIVGNVHFGQIQGYHTSYSTSEYMYTIIPGGDIIKKIR